MVARVSRVTGLAEMRRVLKMLPDRVQKRVMRNAVRSAAVVMRKSVQSAAPVGAESSKASAKYGRLRQNIRVLRLKRVPRGSEAARVDTGRAFWGVWYEFGSSRQPPRPWFRPAVDTASDASVERLRERLAAGILKEALALAGASGRAR